MKDKKQTSTEHELDEPKRKSAARPTRHARFMRGVVTPIFGLLAVAAIGLGIMNATYWKPSSQITATTSVKGAQYVVTDPGVLPLIDDAVRITVTASGGTSGTTSSGNTSSENTSSDSTSSDTADAASDGVCLALGTNKDVTGWLAGSSYIRVTGMSDWSTLSWEKSAAQGSSAAGDGDVSFKDSDMWSKTVCDPSKVTLDAKTSADSGTVAVIDLGKATSAKVSLHWTRHQLPDFAMPFYFAGGLLAILAVLSATLFAVPPHKRRKREVVGSAETAAQGEEVAISEALAGSLAGLKSAVSFKPKSKRRRHAAHRAGAPAAAEPGGETTDGSDSGQPVVIDPSNRNLVADQQAQNAQPDDSETSVITASELQAYFARLSAENSEYESDSETADVESADAETADDETVDGVTLDAAVTDTASRLSGLQGVATDSDVNQNNDQHDDVAHDDTDGKETGHDGE
ncbi:hypothetical protein F7D09_0415 [Bifidobacterium leontopitheci]|uniref:GTPase regulator-like protein n=1 Tax=Bifidobacterium leontopitheci TaxID=2650774 RepID=A0A6I1GNU4_9BIFI|nr:hypothetical protein [Bifidobacterium leontopitheci]KAB7791059.1 hypothetical protein F7D09_0415 [Bifidobacterium leontopitheci]